MEELLTTTVSFTDDEFAAVMASLQLSVASASKHIELQGEDALNKEDKDVIAQMDRLLERLKVEFF